VQTTHNSHLLLRSYNQCMHNMILSNVRITTVATENNKYSKLLCVSLLFQFISNKMQRYSLLHLKTALHVSGGTSTHHQGRIQLYLQHLVFVTRLLLPAAIAAGSSNGVTNIRNIYFSSVGNINFFIQSLYSVKYCVTRLLLSAAIVAGSSIHVTNNRCCRYSCMRSWWWVEVPPETCKAVSRYNKMCNVTSC
jgi:hypothetical protein